MTQLTVATARNPAAVENILIAEVARFTLDALLDSSQRKRNREVERLRLHRAQEEQSDVKYADQAVLANLGWGIDALEEAIQTSTVETKIARLEYAEQMLQVCALLEVGATTAGISNSYLSASANLNLALVWKLRNDDRKTCKYILDMFIADPFSSRVDLAPSLWEALFQPHLTGIMSWYCAQRSKLVTFTSDTTTFTGESVEYSYSRDDFSVFSIDDVAPNVKALSKVTSEQTAQLQVLEKLYQNSLDDHTRQYAKYYKDWLMFGVESSSQRRIGPLMPIAEPPATPLTSADDIQPTPTSQLDVIHEVDDDEDRSVEASLDLKLEPEAKKTFRPSELTKDAPSRQTSLKKNREESLQRSKRRASRSSSFSTSDEFVKQTSGEAQVSSKTFLITRGGFPKQLVDEVCNSNSSSPKQGSPSKSSRSLKKQKSLERNNSTRLFEILQRDVQVGGASSCVTEAEYNTEMNLERVGSRNNLNLEEPSPTGSCCTASDVDFDGSVNGGRRTRPPKDFVCPITNQLFNDPVTLETGQTYERTAIQEWLERGNTTCPITRQPLKSRVLPRTNYVLKRLVENWKELHPGFPNESPLCYEVTSEYYQEEKEDLSQSPSSVISASSSRFFKSGSVNSLKAILVDDLLEELKPPVGRLCMSDNLQECEEAVLAIAAIWERSRGDYRVEANLTKATVIEGVIEVVSVSVSEDVQNAAVRILSALVASDEFTRHTILRADPGLESVIRLLKSKQPAAFVLLFQLKLPVDELNALDLLPELVGLLRSELGKEGADNCTVSPKTAAVLLLQQLVSVSPERTNSSASSALSLGALPSLVENIKARDLDERLATISALLCCIKADGRCRNLVARSAKFNPVVDILVRGSGSARKQATLFFLEIARSSRRTTTNKAFKNVKDEGMVSTMHSMLVYLQKAPMEYRYAVAVLMLHLELLDEVRKDSVYRDEALHAIVIALNSQSFDLQVETINALVSLVGRFSCAGVPLTEVLLLKEAGVEQPYEAVMKGEPHIDEEKEASNTWELNLAIALLEYEQGAIFEALGTTMQSKNVELGRPGLVMAVWLSYMVKRVPDIGVRPLARRFFMAPLVVTLASSKSSQQRVLAALGLHTFLSDPESFQELTYYAKDIIKPLRQLKKVSWIAQEFIEAFIRTTSLNPMDLWQQGQIGMVDTSRNGEVRALVRNKGRLFSGHSDGSIQVWETKKKVPTLLHALREHSKCVTSLAISPSSNKLYSGSLDKTVRVWSIASDTILCTNVLEMKEAVHGVAVTGSTISVNTHGPGVKVQNENMAGSVQKQLNVGKHVQSIAAANGNVYCGCTDNSLQEVNPEEGSVVTIQSGIRTLLGKKPVYVVQVYKSEILTGGPPVEGVAVKIWDQTDYSIKRQVPSSLEVRALAVSDEFLYLGSTSGCVEVWLKERNVRVSVITLGSRVNSLAVDGDMLYSGTEDGKIRVISFC